MKRDGSGQWVLEHPKDLLEFTYNRVHFQRLTKLHEPGLYTVTALRTGNTYAVTGGHSKRFPWRVVDSNGERVVDGGTGGYSNLIDAAVGIAWHDSDLPRPTRSATPSTPEEVSHGR